MTRSRHDQPTEGAWAARPLLSALLRFAIFASPIGAALVATLIARQLLPAPASVIGWAAWWTVMLAVGAGCAWATERLARRFLPLAMLLKLSMLFPDKTPSRFKVARQARNVDRARMNDLATETADDCATQVLALVSALSAHDRHTRGHAERVRVFTELLSEQLKLSPDDRARLRWAALLHDIGKLSVQTRILNKPGQLDQAEWAVIRDHPKEGARLVGPLLAWLGPWGDTIAHHHERFDGKGYPDELAGDDISYGARIVAVADSYDTMTSARPYKRPTATKAARQELVACAGSQFDPVVVRAFLEVSLPRLLWATGPLSLLVHLPYLARLQEIGRASVATAAQTAATTTVAGVAAFGLVGSITPAGAVQGSPVRAPKAAASVQAIATNDSSLSVGLTLDRGNNSPSGDRSNSEGPPRPDDDRDQGNGRSEPDGPNDGGGDSDGGGRDGGGDGGGGGGGDGGGGGGGDGGDGGGGGGGGGDDDDDDGGGGGDDDDDDDDGGGGGGDDDDDDDDGGGDDDDDDDD